ncbi:MAG: SsrA-binding protein SmpB, partial [Deltaproteobacteria bacterium]|nr:SsrA-binding protein SmpB [Deltaproteobacteria bacterium]
MADKKDDGARQLITKNRRAVHDYIIEDRLEAGVVLLGSEVKSCRQGKAQLSDAYVQVKDGEAFLLNSHIAEYLPATRFNHAPKRTRKLLLHKSEIDKLLVRLSQRGQTAVPLSMYFKDGRVKVEIGIGKGRAAVDRRELVKERESRREMERAL